MSKYIIDIPKTVGMEKVESVHYTYFDGIQCQTIVLKGDDLEELNSDYINENFGDLQDTAYQQGFDDGKKEAESSEAIEQAKADAFNKGILFKEEKIHDAYQRGLEDGKWKSEDGCTGCKYEGKTGEHLPCDYCMNNFKNQWTAKDDEIEVGDEVKRKLASENDSCGIVTKEWGDIYYIMWLDGSSGRWDKDRIVKTGRHFDIASILEDMRND